SRVLRDRAEHVALDVEALEDGLLDEVDVRHGLLEALAGGDVLRDEVRGAGREQALLLELARLALQALEGGVRVLDADVGDGHVEAGDGEDLGDAAAHVSGAADGDGRDGHSGELLRPGAPLGRGRRRCHARRRLREDVPWARDSHSSYPIGY